MKKLLAVLLVLCLLPWAVAEEIDLSGLSIDELRALQARIAEEIVSRPEWKEVTVPSGIYKIGADIPAGEYCIRCGKSSKGYIFFEYGEKTNASHSDIEYPRQFCDYIYADGDGKEFEFVNVLLIEGYYVKIEYGYAIFTPPVHADLGF